jgi:ParB-like chromosome segregation protein Spo0J
VSNDLAYHPLADLRPRDTSKYQLMPDMSPAEFETLKADIARRGVVVPIDVDETGEILDGHHRYRAWAELKKNEPPPIIVREGLSEQEKRAFARKNNILRRHLTREQVRQLIAEQLKDSPDWADNRVADELGVDGKTVGSVREELEATSEFPKLDRLVGKDGKSRPRKQPRERRKPDVAALKGKPERAMNPKVASRGDAAKEVAELKARIAELETALDRERELERENGRLRSEVETLRAQIAELEDREASQSQSALASVVQVIELTEDDRRRLEQEMRRLEEEGQQRLPFEWERDAECPCPLCTSQEVAREFSVAAE